GDSIPGCRINGPYRGSFRHPLIADSWVLLGELAHWARFYNETTAQAVIINGDLSINGPDSDTEIAFAAQALKGLRGQVLPLPGNHDIGDEPPGQDPDQIINQARLARWDEALGPDRWTYEAGDWLLIGINAQLFGSGLAREIEQN